MPVTLPRRCQETASAIGAVLVIDVLLCSEQFLDCAVRPQIVSELQVSPGHHTSGTETPRPITAQVNTTAPPHTLAKLGHTGDGCSRTDIRELWISRLSELSVQFQKAKSELSRFRAGN